MEEGKENRLDICIHWINSNSKMIVDHCQMGNCRSRGEWIETKKGNSNSMMIDNNSLRYSLSNNSKRNTIKMMMTIAHMWMINKKYVECRTYRIRKHAQCRKIIIMITRKNIQTRTKITKTGYWSTITIIQM